SVLRALPRESGSAADPHGRQGRRRRQRPWRWRWWWRRRRSPARDPEVPLGRRRERRPDLETRLPTRAAPDRRLRTTPGGSAIGGGLFIGGFARRDYPARARVEAMARALRRNLDPTKEVRHERRNRRQGAETRAPQGAVLRALPRAAGSPGGPDRCQGRPDPEVPLRHG